MLFIHLQVMIRFKDKVVMVRNKMLERHEELSGRMGIGKPSGLELLKG